MNCALEYIVRPEEVHHLQKVDHESHKQRRYEQYVSILQKMVPRDIVVLHKKMFVGLREGPAAASDVDNHPAAHPDRNGKYVKHSCKAFVIVLGVLHNLSRYTVEASSVESQITQVMDKDHEHADEPVVGEVAEQDQEGGHTVVKQVFVVVPLWLEQRVGDRPVEVLAKGHQNVQSHGKSVFGDRRGMEVGVDALTTSAQPRRHHAGVLDDEVASNTSDSVDDNRVRHLGQGSHSFLFRVLICVAILPDKVVTDPRIKNLVGDQFITLDKPSEYMEQKSEQHSPEHVHHTPLPDVSKLIHRLEEVHLVDENRRAYRYGNEDGQPYCLRFL